jgi:hypothetical protein
MSTEKSKLPSPSHIFRKRKPVHSHLLYERTHMTFSVPKTIYRIYKHPLIRFPPDALSTLVDDAHDLDLEDVALVDLNRFETVKKTIDVHRSVFLDFKEVAKRRGCTADVLINSTIAEWMDIWYSDGRPKTFQEICRIVAIDCFLNSAEDELLYFYFNGVFGRPTKLVDDSHWSELPLPDWVLELQAKYKDV